MAGGTGITNFDIGEMPLYQAALARCKREDLVLVSVGFTTPYNNKLEKRDGSLHCIGERDMGDFFQELACIRFEIEHQK